MHTPVKKPGLPVAPAYSSDADAASVAFDAADDVDGGWIEPLHVDRHAEEAVRAAWASGGAAALLGVNLNGVAGTVARVVVAELGSEGVAGAVEAGGGGIRVCGKRVKVGGLGLEQPQIRAVMAMTLPRKPPQPWRMTRCKRRAAQKPIPKPPSGGSIDGFPIISGTLKETV